MFEKSLDLADSAGFKLLTHATARWGIGPGAIDTG